MAEVLSQEKIDALLNAAQSGGVISNQEKVDGEFFVCLNCGRRVSVAIPADKPFEAISRSRIEVHKFKKCNHFFVSDNWLQLYGSQWQQQQRLADQARHSRRGQKPILTYMQEKHLRERAARSAAAAH